jgi:hypothetical protein
LTISSRTVRPPTRLRIGLGLAAVALILAGCDPGYGASAINRSGISILIRDGTDKWALPAHASGLIFGTLGEPKDAAPIDYEILDAESCRVLAVQHVDFAKNPEAVVLVAADGSVGLGSPDPSMEAGLVVSDSCPGAADGWSLWVVNHTADQFYVRTRGTSGTTVAKVRPTSGAMAVGGDNEASTIELLDADCHVVDTYERTGWGYFKGTIDGGKLTITPGITPVATIPSYEYSSACDS